VPAIRKAKTGDCTEHAETNLVRDASTRYEVDRLRQATLYAGTEPSAMCAGAVFWTRIGRVVFGLRAGRLCEMKGLVYTHNLTVSAPFATGFLRLDQLPPCKLALQAL